MPLTLGFTEYAQAQIEMVHRALDAYVHPAQLKDTPAVLIESVRYSLLGGGKMLRPMLVLSAADLCGGSMEAALPAACAVEMLHTFSLIHDDLPTMDNADLRRGRPSNHKVFGEAISILAGDTLLGLAFQILAEAAVDPQTGPVKASLTMLEMARAAGLEGMAAGQVLDLISEGVDVDVAQLERTHRLKTEALLTACLRMGAIMAGGSTKQMAALDRYARALGLAFQIHDDVLDVVGAPAKLGKPVGSDACHNKATYVKRYGLEEARRLACAYAADASAALVPFGEKAAMLQALAAFVVERDN